MALRNTDSYIVEVAEATPSLPDPVTVANRTHLLVNTGAVAAVFSSIGATPFEDPAGSPVATLTVLPGRAREVRSDGVRWVLQGFDAATSSRRVYSATGVTDAAGNVTFTHNAPAFAVAPVCAISVQTGNTNATEARITANSTTATTVNVRQAPGVVILGISVLQVPQPLAGATVHIVAVEPGLV